MSRETQLAGQNGGRNRPQFGDPRNSISILSRSNHPSENSYKFTHEAIRLLLEDAGFDVERIWMDDRDWYPVTLARVGKTRNQYDVTMSPAITIPHVQRKSGPVGHRI